MSIAALMRNRAYVLEFRLQAESNMDAKRVYYRRTDPTTGKKEIVACRVSQLSSSESLMHAIRGSEITHQVYFSDNPNLREENRLEINGLQYLLLGIPMNASQADRLWTLDVKMVTQQNELATVIE